jgi:glucose/arabinose dehydrogenase
MNFRTLRFPVLSSVFALASGLALPVSVSAATVANPLCPNNTALFNPGTGQDIVVPPGFKVSVFASGLNMPTGIAFLGNAQGFQVYGVWSWAAERLQRTRKLRDR